MRPLFEVKGLKKYFPIVHGLLRRTVGNVKAVDGIDLSIYPGEVFGMVGESGSGKSTAARAAIRLIEPTEGEIRFMETDVRALTAVQLRTFRKQIQIVFQDPYASLNPRKTICDAIGEPMEYHHLIDHPDQKEERVVEILNRVGLSGDYLWRYPHELSGGQQQRVCIGRAIGLEPKLIICDEAVSALDVSVRAQILNLLVELQNTMNLSYWFISHDLSVVRYIAHRLAVIENGKIVEEGESSVVFASPKNVYTKKLIAAIPRSALD